MKWRATLSCNGICKDKFPEAWLHYKIVQPSCKSVTCWKIWQEIFLILLTSLNRRCLCIRNHKTLSPVELYNISSQWRMITYHHSFLPSLITFLLNQGASLVIQLREDVSSSHSLILHWGVLCLHQLVHGAWITWCKIAVIYCNMYRQKSNLPCGDKMFPGSWESIEMLISCLVNNMIIIWDGRVFHIYDSAAILF